MMRSILFFVLFQLWTILMVIVMIPCAVLPRRATVVMAHVWLKGVHALLGGVVGMRARVIGKERIPEGPVLIAAKHQSAFETFTFHLLFGDPSYILKQELTWIPLFGWYLKKSGVVSIDRSGGTKALKAMVKGAQAAIDEGRPVIIFPEGTRTAPGERQPYHSGVAMLYTGLNVPVVPVALNSGLFWRRRGFLKRPGEVSIEFLDAIPPGLDRKTFMARLENEIETATDRLVQSTQSGSMI